MNRALFLDRDGVLDELVSQAGEWGAPLEPAQVQLRPGVREALELAAKNGWLIVVISNQPDAAKGKTTMESLRAVHERLLQELNGAPIQEFFYCFHRAEDRCACRKPQPTLVLEAAKRYDINVNDSWFVGDVDTDIECGRRAGAHTALLEYPHTRSRRGAQRADRVCRDLRHFVHTLVSQRSSDAPQSND
jgi:D-glycero-D-manno-heptose 1,7-bisphosphate phosphatase